VKRLFAVGFLAAALLSTMVATPGAQASPAGRVSTSCSFAAKLKFRPSLKEGVNHFAFIKIYGNVRGCSGGQVTSGRMVGGSEGDIRCRDGVVRGPAIAKARIDWDTGAQSGLNWIFGFSKSRLHGQVVAGLFQGDRMFSRFSLASVRGLCRSGDPLEMSKLKGALRL
jgi:hypothetical protein